MTEPGRLVSSMFSICDLHLLVPRYLQQLLLPPVQWDKRSLRTNSYFTTELTGSCMHLFCWHLVNSDLVSRPSLAAKEHGICTLFWGGHVLSSILGSSMTKTKKGRIYSGEHVAISAVWRVQTGGFSVLHLVLNPMTLWFGPVSGRS